MNPTEDIRSHSSLLYNLEVSNLLSEVNAYGKQVRADPTMSQGRQLYNLYAVLRTLWANVRCIIRTSPVARNRANLEVTKYPGLYVPDLLLRMVEHRLRTFNLDNPITQGQAYEIADMLDAVESFVRDALQAMGYFARFETRTKPDINMAADSYLARIDNMTEKDLVQLAGTPDRIIKQLTEGTGADVEQAMYDQAEEDEDD